MAPLATSEARVVHDLRIAERTDASLSDTCPVVDIASPFMSRRMPTKVESQVYSYWQERAESFGLDGKKTDAWAKLIQPHLPAGKSQRILDVGCGTGAIGLSLARRGHNVVGIDLSDNMLAQARHNAAEQQVSMTFMRALADSLPFENEAFDCVVHRNVMWNLPNPDASIKQWFDVLAPGGMLIYFDSDWYGYLHDKQRSDLRQKLYGNGPVSFAGTMENIARTLPMTQAERPQWDADHLLQAGFEMLEVRSVAAEVWTPEERLRHTFAPQFMVVARKPNTCESAIR
ncbi:MAG: class I SAM-dependent methyltransferase [Eggerthellaceae bacterium]